jgi:hypothetical protein
MISFVMEAFKGVSLIPWCTLTCKYLCEFSKKFKMVLMRYSRVGGKLIHEKTKSKKSRDTVPLNVAAALTERNTHITQFT